jgi:hypothetical protein
MMGTISTLFAAAWAWITAHRALLFPIIAVFLVLKLFAWLFKGIAVVIALLLKPDPGATPRTLQPKGLGASYFVKPHWNKARDLYVLKRRL